MRDIVVFDLDGTLSLVGDRLKYLKNKDWDSFYEACEEDAVNEDIRALFNSITACGADVRIVTGRRESVRDKTWKWLHDNGMPINMELIYMRKDGDTRHDTEVKPELISRFKDKISLIFEDRNSMVAKWRELGFTCLQVAEGDF